MNKKILAIILSTGLLWNSANAAINDIFYDYEAEAFRVSGDVPIDVNGATAIEILKPDKTVYDADPYAYIGKLPLNSNKEFDAEIPFNGATGKYMFRIGSKGAIFERGFLFINKDEALEYFMASDGDELERLQAILGCLGDAITPVMPLWDNNLTSPQKQSVALKLKNSDVNTLADAANAFCDSVILTALNDCKTKGQQLNIIKQVNELLNVKDLAYFNNLSEAKQVSVLGSMPNNFSSVDEFCAKLEVAIADYKKPSPTKQPSSGGGSSGSGESNKGYLVNTGTPKQDVVSATELPTTSGMAFADIADVEWAKPSIEALYNNNIIRGKSNTSFAPNDSVTREEFTSMIIKALALDDKSATSVSFVDVTTDDWFYSVIQSALSRGIIKGVSEDNFGTGQNVIRQDATLICKRALEAVGVVFDSDDRVFYSADYATDWTDFKDAADIDDYAKDAADALRKSGIINGDSDRLFHPRDFMSRAEAAVLINKVMAFSKNAGNGQLGTMDPMVDALTALGIYTDGTNGLDEELNRGEAAKLTCVLLKLSTAMEENAFADCIDNPNKGAINAVYQKGLIASVGEHTFNPSGIIAFEDAVAIASRSLGSAVLSTNAMAVASENGILDGVVATDSNGITKRNFLRLFYNLLDKKVIFTTYDEYATIEKSNTTFLDVYHGIKTLDNVKVIANERAGIDGNSEAGKGNINVGGFILSNSKPEYNEHIGRLVKCYYVETGVGEYTLLYLVDKRKTQLLKLSSDDIYDYKDFEYTYYTDSAKSKTRIIKVKNTVNVIYNGQTVFDYPVDMLNPSSGCVTFVDSNGDGIYDKEDTLIITAYQNVVVGSINKAKQSIYDKYSSAYSLNLENVYQYTVKDQHGDEYGLSELREWDVLATITSPDGDYVDITLVDEAYGGSFDALYTADDEIVLSGKTYKLAKDFRGDISQFKIGSDVTVYLDLFGNISAISDGISEHALNKDAISRREWNKRIVVLTMCAYNSDTEKEFIKTYGADEKLTYTELADKVSINGVSMKSDKALEELKQSVGKGVIVNYNTNQEVYDVVTPAKPGVDKQRGLWEITYEGESLLYKSTGAGSFGNRFIPGDVVYTIPTKTDDYNDESKFGYNKARFSNDVTYDNEIVAYTTSFGGMQADAVIYKSGENDLGNFSSDTVFVIGKINKQVNIDNEVALFADGFEYNIRLDNVTPKTYEFDDDAMVVDIFGNKVKNFSISDLSAGDVIRMGISHDRINTVSVAYDADKEWTTENNGSFSGYTYGGNAYDISPNKQFITIADNSIDPTLIDVSSYENGGKYLKTFNIRKEALITVVDMTENNVVLNSGTVADIQTAINAGLDCSQVVICCDWQSWVTAVIVYVK